MIKKRWLFILVGGLFFITLSLAFGNKISAELKLRHIANERSKYTTTPEGGINETKFVEINGTMQWINIYGEDKNNPVLLYLHGGPCKPTSYYDWKVLRNLSHDYTVVSWDQRGCGHNYPDYAVNTSLNKDDMISDGLAMTNFLCEHLNKDQITLFGHSWGSLLAANLAIKEPDKYEAIIVASLVVDVTLSRQYCKNFLLQKAEENNDKVNLEKIKEFDPYDLSEESLDVISGALEKYCSDEDKPDEDFEKWLLLNPNEDMEFQKNIYYKYIQNNYSFPQNRDIYGSDYADYEKMLLQNSTDMKQQMSILNTHIYQMPFYLIEGKYDRRPNTMYSLAIKYYNSIDSKKELFELDGGHSSPILQSKWLCDTIHCIALKQKSLTQ